MRDQLFTWIQLVYDPVSILLHTCCKDYDFVVLSHFSQKLSAVGSDQEIGFILFAFIDIMYQCLVKVKHKCVFSLGCEPAGCCWLDFVDLRTRRG